MIGDKSGNVSDGSRSRGNHSESRFLWTTSSLPTIICVTEPFVHLKSMDPQCLLNIYVIPDLVSVREVEQAVIRSLDTWNRAAGPQTFQYAGRVNWEQVFADDGYNTISFVSMDWHQTTTGASATPLITGVTALWRVNDPIGDPPDAFSEEVNSCEHSTLRSMQRSISAQWNLPPID